MLKLKAIIKATGGAANLSLHEIEELSSEIGIATLASTQKVRDAAGILLTFKSIQGDTFKSALRLTQDLAEVGFGDLRTASMQLGKALEEPIVGLGALRRVGVSFTESQKEQIRVLSMTGEKTKAQEIIIRALNEQVGGAGVKAASGLHGEILNTREKIAERNKKLADNEELGFMSFGKDPKIAHWEEHLEGLERQLRSINAIIKDGIESTKKENELYNYGNQLKKEETDLGKIREKSLNTYIRNTERQIENLGKTSKEMRELNELRKIEDK